MNPAPPTPTKRVLILLTEGFGGFGGIAQYNRNLIEALDGLDDVGIIEGLPRIADAVEGSLPAKLKHNLSGLGGRARYALASLKLGLFGPKPSVVICAHINLITLAWIIARFRRAPLVLLTHGVDVWQPPRGMLANRAVRGANAIVSIGQFSAERMANWVTFLPNQLHYWPNVIRQTAYGMAAPAADLIDRYGLANKRVIMTLGRLDAREKAKGFDQILEALPDLRSRQPDLVYLIAGKGDDRERLEAKTDALGLSDYVVFTGEVEEARKADHYRLATVYAMPSKLEGFGIVFLEALACGVPVVASRFDGGFDAILRGKLGRAVDPNSREELVSAIEGALIAPHVIPPELEQFAFPAFRERVRQTLASL